MISPMNSPIKARTVLLAAWMSVGFSQALALAAGAAAPEPVVSTPAPSAAPSAPVAPAKGNSEGIAKVQSLLDAKRFTEALSEIEFLLKAEPKNAELLKSRGFALRETGKFKDAVQSYVEALKIDPQLHVAKEYLAVTYLRMGETKPTKQLYAELKKDAPELAKMVLAEAKRLKLKL